MSEQGVIVPKEDEELGKTPDLRDQVAAAFADLKEKAETPEEKDQRVRDEAGRFTKSEAQPETPEKKRETLTLPAATTGRGEIAAASETTPPPQEIKPPATWSAEGKAIFATLPPAAIKEIQKREADVMRAITAQDEDRGLGKRIREESAPYMHIIRAEGGDENASYKSFLNYAYVMRQGSPQQKVAALHQLAQVFNVPLGQSPQQGQADPVFQTLEQQRAEIQRIRQELDQDRQSRLNQETASITGELAAFASAPGHEHFESVRELMGILIETGKASDMDDAYDKAVYATPEIRSTLQAQQTSAAETQRLAKIKQATGAARQAAGSIAGGPGGAQSLNGTGVKRSLEDEIRANLRSAQGRI